jgi:hypothetical protein
MSTTTIHDLGPDPDATLWVACERCGHLEHPEFICDQASQLVEAGALRELLWIHGPVMLAALGEAADDRVERTRGPCSDCLRSAEERCEDHGADLERAAEYRRTSDALAAALDA